ncbi:MAG: OPT/YSL family transporter [Candidatus Thorarchaeota archaeon]
MKRLESTRALLAGLFGAGLFYALLVVAEGRMDYGIFVAVLLEAILLIGSITQKPLDKKGLGLICVAAVLYIAFSVLLTSFSEIVVMATGGLAIYAALMSEPKFPLTKRAIGTGIVVGVIMTFLGIYLALKLGVVYFVGAELLGFLLLSMNGKYTPQENVVVVSIANSASMVSIGVLITFPAIAIFAPAEISASLITYQFIAFVTGISAVFGLLLMAPFRDRFEHESWPQVKPQAETIKSLGADKASKVTVLTGLSVSAAWVGTTKVAEVMNEGLTLSSFPHAIAPMVPDWIGVSNSPLIGAIGFFVGWKRVLIMLAGSLASLFIWIVLEGAAPILYGDHLTRPEILYLAIGIFVTVIVGDVFSSKKGENPAKATSTEAEEKTERTSSQDAIIARLMRVKQELFTIEVVKEEIREMIADPREYLAARKGQVPPWVAVVSMLLFMITGIIVFSIIRPFANLDISWILFVFGAPVALLSAYFTARAISETGMLAGYISDMVAIPAILLFRTTFQAITTFMSMLGALQDAAIALLVHLKLGSLTGVRGRDVMKSVFVGALLGTFVGSLITYMLYITYGFGGSEFPAPAAQLFGFLVVSLTGLSNFQLPGLDRFTGVHPILAFLYLVLFAVVGFLAGRELTKRGLSPMSLAVGLLIPPATTIAMLFGGYIDYRLKKQHSLQSGEDPTETPKYRKVMKLLSGIIAGEAIITVIWVLYSAILFFI